jgi:hypothetical protein
MKSIILIGGGGHCKSVIDVIEQEGKFEIAGIVDKSEPLGADILGYSVIDDDRKVIDLFVLDSELSKRQYENNGSLCVATRF